MNSNSFHEILINSFVTMIEYPVTINKKVGYKLSNGATIIFKNGHGLSNQSRIRLAKHYEKRGINVK
tara:strand:- start:976 stop:1176 length:201 start_codon:yes stop_codon:yes gene_type:complete